MGGHDYTEHLKQVNDSIAIMSQNVDTLVAAMTAQQKLEEEKSRNKVVEKRQQREEERASHRLATEENNTILANAIATSLTTALNTQLTQTTTNINTQLTASLRALFTEFIPHIRQNNGDNNGAPPPPPPPPPNPPPPNARASAINLKFPCFDGEDPDGWIFNADKYFSVHQADDALKITIAGSSLKGDANVWYRWKQTKVQIVTWLEFCAHIRARFSPNKFVDARIAIATIDQIGTVREHIPAFEKLMNFVDFDEDHLVQCFIRSLKPHIGNMVKLLAPQTLNEAFTKAIHQEEAHTSAQKFTTRTPYRPPPIRGALPTTSAPIKKLNLPTGYKKLTWDEMKERREKGLCFNCDEQFKSGHVCPNLKPGYLLLEMGSSSTVEITEIEDSPAEEPQAISDDLAPLETAPSISLHSLMGSTFPNTMRITGFAKTKPITILVDSGATHNFLHPSVAKQCGFPVTSLDSMLHVTVGDGGQLKTKGSCSKIPIKLQQHIFLIDFHLLEISGCDAVLGIDWLRTLGKIEWDFEKLTMQFRIKDSAVTLTGNQSSAIMMMDVSPMRRLLSTENHAILFELIATTSAAPQSVLLPSIEQLLSSYADIFSTPTSLPPERLQDHKISLLPEAGPVNVRPYRYPHFQKDEIEKIVGELQQAGFIRPSSSPFSSPILMVRKKDGSWRMCVDYRALNKITIKDRYPIPVVDELLDELHGAQVFTKLDLRSGYHQIRVHEADVSKTAFRTHDGHYEFLVMPFGLSNAPATFQSLMNHIFRLYLRKFVLVFFDDILIYSRNIDEHLKHLELVFALLRKHKLFVKESKCTFAQKSVGYLGHLISSDGVSVEPEKIQCILSWKTPSTVKELRGFLGLAGYYRKFVKDFGKISAPLTQLLKKDAFKWTAEATIAFKLLQQALTTTPVLILPDFSKEFYLECDASGGGIGAVLMQCARPIAFYSKPLSGKNLNLSVYDKEMLAIVCAVNKWRPYLLGRHFKIYTDHRSLKYFLEQRLSSIEQQKWVSKLLGYDYEIIYRSGSSNKAADALSRLVNPQLLAISAPIFSGVDDIIAECHTDPTLRALIDQLQLQPDSKRHYTYVNGVLRYKGRIVVVQSSEWCRKLLHDFHSTPLGGHSGYLRTFKRLQQNFHWSGMKHFIKEYIQHCEICQRNKTESVAPPGLLSPLPIPSDVWIDISMDFIDGFPPSHGKSSILVIVDRLTKYAHFVALSHPYTASTIADLFVREVVRLHGMPKTITSDRDPIFMSNFWESYFAMQDTQLCKSSAYHPQSDGQTEVTNRTLECYLRCFAGMKPKDWFRWLAWAEWWYNTSYHSAIKMTPYEALYSRPPPAISAYLPGSTPVNDVDLNLRARDHTLKLLKSHLSDAQARMKNYTDSHRTERQFSVDDFVYLRLQPYRQITVANQSFSKLSPRFYGPFKVLEKIGTVAYKLDLPVTSRIHPVFHVSQLKLKLGPTTPIVTTLPAIIDYDKWEPEAILDRRMYKKGNQAGTQWLLQWKGHSKDDATWEDADDICVRFPELAA